MNVSELSKKTGVSKSALYWRRARGWTDKQIEESAPYPNRHGQCSTSTHNIWASMIQRCLNPKSQAYKWYGGRGIAVCERWRTFTNFVADMGSRPAGLTIDRIDTNGNYEPGNCRWATPKQQANNQRTNRLIAIGGEVRTLAEWADAAGLNHSTLHRRLRAGWSGERAITTPLAKSSAGIKAALAKKKLTKLERVQ
jgi:hypothetical protein